MDHHHAGGNVSLDLPTLRPAVTIDSATAISQPTLLSNDVNEIVVLLLFAQCHRAVFFFPHFVEMTISPRLNISSAGRRTLECYVCYSPRGEREYSVQPASFFDVVIGKAVLHIYVAEGIISFQGPLVRRIPFGEFVMSQCNGGGKPPGISFSGPGAVRT